MLHVTLYYSFYVELILYYKKQIQNSKYSVCRYIHTNVPMETDWYYLFGLQAGGGSETVVFRQTLL